MLALLLRADRHRRLRTCTIQATEESGLLDVIAPERRYESWHVVDADGRVSSAGRALTKVLAALPVGRRFAVLTRALPGLTERAYGWVAAHRRLLSRPIPPAAKRRARGLVQSRAVNQFL